MARLTHERVNGIKDGYWSPAKKDELVQRLGGIEYGYERIAESVCDRICKYYDINLGQEDLDEHCNRCPLNTLDNLILEGAK